VRGNESLQQSLCLLQKEVLDLRDANKGKRWENVEIRNALGKLRVEFAQEQTNHAQKQEAMKREIADLGQGNSDQQRENAGRLEEIAGLRRQQETFAQDIENLKQQIVELSRAQSNSDKKIGDLNGQMAPKIANLAQDLGDLKQQIVELGGAQSNSDKKIGDLGTQLAQRKQEVDKIWEHLRRKKIPLTSEPLGGALEFGFEELLAAAYPQKDISSTEDESRRRILQEILGKRNSAATTLLQELLSQPLVRSVTNWRAVRLFFKSVAKDPDATKQKVMVILLAVNWSRRKLISHLVQKFFGCEAVCRYWKIGWRLRFLASTFLHRKMDIRLELILQRTVKERSKFIFASSG
jgi:phage host-nuclease inhibitor protein Gam